jgi:hypothetical protein
MTYDPPIIGYKVILNFVAYSAPAKGGYLLIGAAPSPPPCSHGKSGGLAPNGASIPDPPVSRPFPPFWVPCCCFRAAIAARNPSTSARTRAPNAT